MEAGIGKRYGWARVRIKRNKGESPVVSQGFKWTPLPNAKFKACFVYLKEMRTLDSKFTRGELVVVK